MSSQTPHNAEHIDEGEDWEIIPKPKSHQVDHQSGNNHYVYFQMSCWFGHLSYIGRTGISKEQKNTPRFVATQLKGPIHQQEQSYFFQMPAEIRLYIYEMLFRMPMADYGVKLRQSSGQGQFTSVLESLLTCRRFEDEAVGIFYSINRIFLDNAQILASLGERRRDVLTMATVTAQSAPSLLADLPQLQRLPHLKSLHIVRAMSVKYIDPRSWAVMAPQIITEIEKMSHLEEVKIITSIANPLTEHDMVRKKRLDEIDRRICGAASQPAVA